ncbi:MAG: FHA domain-containing protein [Acidimicrobiia bacterium]|nr:FHA domain-containing protein [Acidimicrobiia bacterium]
MADEQRTPDELNDVEKTVFYDPEAGTAEVGEVVGKIEGAFRYALVVERGPRAGLTYVLGEGETVAGRSDDVEIFLGDVTVSRRHARFVVDDRGLTVEDLRSTNGTYVNAERHDKAHLQPGDEVIIGKFHLVVAGGHG